MTPHKHWIRNYTPVRISVRLANGQVIYSEGVGSVVFALEVKEQLVREVEFSRVFHVPELGSNLLSVLYLVRHRNFAEHTTELGDAGLKVGLLATTYLLWCTGGVLAPGAIEIAPRPIKTGALMLTRPGALCEARHQMRAELR